MHSTIKFVDVNSPAAFVACNVRCLCFIATCEVDEFLAGYIGHVMTQETVPSRFRLKKMAIYYLLLSELCKTDAIVPVTVFLHRGRDIPDQLDMMVDDDRLMWFRSVSVVLPDWQALDHIDPDNVVEQVLLTPMSGRAIRNLIRLEKDTDNVLNFEKFIRAYAQLDAEEERRY